MKFELGEKVYIKLKDQCPIKSDRDDYDIMIDVIPIVYYNHLHAEYFCQIEVGLISALYPIICDDWNDTTIIGSYTFIKDFDKYNGKLGSWIGENALIKDELIKPKTNGCYCKSCKDFYPYAESNQTDGSLICYVCRQRP